MTQILSTHSAQVQEMRTLRVLYDGLIRERNGAMKQLNGLKQLVTELHQTQQDVLHYKDRANHCEMALLRTEAHLKKTKTALWNAKLENSELTDRIVGFEEERGHRHWIPSRSQGAKDESARDVSDSEEDLETDSAPIETLSGSNWQHHKPDIERRKPNTDDRGVQATPSPDDIAASIPKEKHDLVLKDNVRLQFLVQELTRKEGLSYKKVLQISELEDQIKQLRSELQSKGEQLQKLRRDIQQAKNSEDVAGQLLDTQLKLEKAQKSNAMKQALNETLSQNVQALFMENEKLKKDLEQEKKLREQAETAGLSSGTSTKAEKETNTEPGSFTMELVADETDGTPIARRPTPKDDNSAQPSSIIAQPSDEIDSANEERPQWEQKEKTEALEQQVKHLKEKVDRLTRDCKRLLTEKVMAIRDREMYETRYNELMETVKQTSSSSSLGSTCSECRDHEKTIKKLQEEMSNMKSEIEMVTAQKRMFEEDLQQEQLDAEQNKERVKAQLESWRKNCVTLAKQVNVYQGDIEKERQKVKILERQMGLLQQRASQAIRAQQQANLNRPFATMGFQAPTGLCATEAERPHFDPFQEGFSPSRRGILVTDGVGGGGVDQFDGGRPDEKEYVSRDTLKSAAGHKNECPRCKREFELNEQAEYQRHIEKCLDKS